jgi:chaperonin cofactor prefoldin
MAEDNIDLRFLGQQVQVLQTDVRALRAGEADIKTQLLEMRAEMHAKFEQIDARFEQIDARFEQIDARFVSIDRRFASIDVQFKQMAETAALNLQIVLAAIKK